MSELTMQTLSDELKEPLTQLLLSIADDKLMLGHRDSDWTGLAPILEEDIAFSAMSQEEIAHASAFYELVGEMLGQRADDVAFGRTREAYRCANLTVLSDEFDWARAIVRQFFCDHLDLLRLSRLGRSSIQQLASLAKRIHAEEVTHVEHCDTWMIHLGKGDEDSHRRTQKAIDLLVPHAGMLFEVTEGIELLEQEGVYPLGETDMFDQWQRDVQRVVADAGLKIDLQKPASDEVGGRRGRHGDEFTELLDEMCEVYRVEPEASW